LTTLMAKLLHPKDAENDSIIKIYVEESIEELSSNKRQHFSKLKDRSILPGLRGLFVSETGTITDSGIGAIVKSCVGLLSLDFSNCPHVHMNVFMRGEWVCERLIELNISGLQIRDENISNTNIDISDDGEDSDRDEYNLDF